MSICVCVRLAFYQVGKKCVQTLRVSLVSWNRLRRQSVAELRGWRYPEIILSSWKACKTHTHTHWLRPHFTLNSLNSSCNGIDKVLERFLWDSGPRRHRCRFFQVHLHGSMKFMLGSWIDAGGGAKIWPCHQFASAETAVFCCPVWVSLCPLQRQLSVVGWQK